jgi:hypothetical protein
VLKINVVTTPVVEFCVVTARSAALKTLNVNVNTEADPLPVNVTYRVVELMVILDPFG